jgi:predicted methyltransferase
MGPLLTSSTVEQLRLGRGSSAATIECSLDLQRSMTLVGIGEAAWSWNCRQYPYPETCKERTVYYWRDERFLPVAQYTTALVKLIPTEWGPPTFEIDGIKMLPTAQVSPYADAERKVALIRPRGKVILDTCGGLGYFAAWCLQGRASKVLSFEKNPAVIWLRSMNPWSPTEHQALTLAEADITEAIIELPNMSIDAALHDPPRFGIAGELYSQSFYDQLSRVLKHRGRLFHYTGSPNKASSGRDLGNEVAQRLRHAGFVVEKNGDGVLAVKT